MDSWSTMPEALGASTPTVFERRKTPLQPPRTGFTSPKRTQNLYESTSSFTHLIASVP